MKLTPLLSLLLTWIVIIAPTPVSAGSGGVTCLADVRCGPYDIVLVAGQSNATSRGVFPAGVPARDNSHIWQIGRRTIPRAIVPAFEPLEAVTWATNGASFALPFARAYRKRYLKPGRRVLIVPVARGASAVVGVDAYWAPDGAGVAEAQDLMRSVVRAFPGSRHVATLWHQGESDVLSPADDYRRALRKTLRRISPAGVPLILGQILDTSARTAAMNRSIEAIAREMGAGIASASGLSHLRGDVQHFDGPSQERLGARYFCEFQVLKGRTCDSAVLAHN